jgi:hypothetical protein
VNKEEQLRRGQAAAELLDSGVLSRALDGVEAELSEAWKSSNPVDVAGRERMYLMVQLISDIGGCSTSGRATLWSLTTKQSAHDARA